MMDKNYDFKSKEAAIYKQWDDSKYFQPDLTQPGEPFSIVMPPPNANGALHIGHALFLTLEDLMARYARMKSRPTLLFPGADHAGILTQVVFERELKKKNISRYKLGREEFVRQCMAFSQKNKAIMYNQFKLLGTSADWTREKFTLDPDVSQQVINTFVKLNDDGLIYRDHRMINWCPRCMTALSNLEVTHQEVVSKIWHIKYPLTTKGLHTGQTKYIVVATTRPETMLGDTAVAVHPDDSRYQQFIGETVDLPLTGRQIPIIADHYVDTKFGSGAVKVTPAHDPNDFDMAERHNLEILQVVDFNNKMTAAAGSDYAGLKVEQAREKVLDDLKSLDLLVATKNHKHEVGHCERCKTVLQPQYSLQWFIKMDALRDKGIEVIKSGEVEIIPKRFEKQYLNWMANLHDWCISRQLWWGHQIPVYYCGLEGMSSLQKKMNPELVEQYKDSKSCGKHIIASQKPDVCPHCGGSVLIQDPDTFDTWFSSGQWAHNPLGYPDSDTYKKFYPTSVMETGYDILPIWVARMIMLSTYRTGKIPFKQVYLHGLVRDGKGQKMSKSKGNVVNPVEIVDKYGADALRMALVVGATTGNDISISEEKIKGYRNFGNKLWNIGRFIEMNSEAKDIPQYQASIKGIEKTDLDMVKTLNQVVKKVTMYLDKHKYSLAGEMLYDFIWNKLANEYMETSKERVRNGDLAVLSTLKHIYIICLKLLHPYMPFVTEVIWQQFPHKQQGDLIVAKWPQPQS